MLLVLHMYYYHRPKEW